MEPTTCTPDKGAKVYTFQPRQGRHPPRFGDRKGVLLDLTQTSVMLFRTALDPPSSEEGRKAVEKITSPDYLHKIATGSKNMPTRLAATVKMAAEAAENPDGPMPKKLLDVSKTSEIPVQVVAANMGLEHDATMLESVFTGAKSSTAREDAFNRVLAKIDELLVPSNPDIPKEVSPFLDVLWNAAFASLDAELNSKASKDLLKRPHILVGFAISPDRDTYESIAAVHMLKGHESELRYIRDNGCDPLVCERAKKLLAAL